jgi:hypothetical protein
MNGEIVLPVLHADWDVPVVLMPVVAILAGTSGDGVDWHSDDSWGSPRMKRISYEGSPDESNGNVKSWAEWLEHLSTVGIRNPIWYDPWWQGIGRLMNGHHRFIGAWDLGWTHVPVILQGKHSDRCIGGADYPQAHRISNRKLDGSNKPMW